MNIVFLNLSILRRPRALEASQDPSGTFGLGARAGEQDGRRRGASRRCVAAALHHWNHHGGTTLHAASRSSHVGACLASTMCVDMLNRIRCCSCLASTMCVDMLNRIRCCRQDELYVCTGHGEQKVMAPSHHGPCLGPFEYSHSRPSSTIHNSFWE